MNQETPRADFCKIPALHVFSYFMAVVITYIAHVPSN